MTDFRHIAIVAISFIAGAIVGSFLNVLIYRVPRKESIVYPPSRCPKCRAPIKPWHNIPIISYLMLRGKCKSCGASISLRYPIVEVITAISFALIYVHYGLDKANVFLYVLFPFLIAVSAIDIELHKIPNRLIFPVLIIAILLMLATNPSRWRELFLSALISSAILLIIALAWPGGMGMGDVKLILVLGVFLGKYVFVALSLGVLFGGLMSIVLLLAGLKGRKDAIPFGPYLAFGSAISSIWGEPLLRWYLSLLGSR